MEAPQSHTRPSHLANRLLAALPADELSRLAPHLAVVSMTSRTVLADEGDVIEHIYFPHRGVISLMILSADGGAAETATVGPEGFVGVAAVLGRGRAYEREVVQVSGSASRIPVARLKEAMLPGTQLFRLLHLYLGAFVAGLLRAAACNALHSVEQRCARWLLMAHDRAEADRFDLTQTFLSEMLGVRRASVNLVSRAFQRAGLIDYDRGAITIRDRAGLEAMACDCYRAARQVMDDALSPP